MMEAPCNYANPLGVGATMQSHSSLAISQNKQWDFKNLKNTQWEPDGDPEKSLLHSYPKVNNSPFCRFSLV